MIHLPVSPYSQAWNNHFDDKIYNYTIPAHFAYDNMGPAFQNWGLKLEATINTSPPPDCHGNASITLNGTDNGVLELLAEGDEFIVADVEMENRLVVTNGQNPTITSNIEIAAPKTKATLLEILDTNGDQVPDEFFFDIEDVNALSNLDRAVFHLVRSGKRNLITASAGSITAKKDPTSGRAQAVNCNASVPTGSNSTEVVPVSKINIDDVLNADAIVFNDHWDLEVDDCDPISGQLSNTGNAFSRGERGIWRPSKSYTYVTGRLPIVPEDNNTRHVNVNLREDGMFSGMPLFNWQNPFFLYCDQTDAWTLTNEITKYGNNGEEVENRNILGLYNAALYGYNDNVAIAVGSNNRYYEFWI